MPPNTAGTFWKKFRKDPGKTPEALSELFLELPREYGWKSLKANHSRAFEASRAFRKFSPPQYHLGTRGPLRAVMEFPAVLRAFLIISPTADAINGIPPSPSARAISDIVRHNNSLTCWLATSVLLGTPDGCLPDALPIPSLSLTTRRALHRSGGT